MSNGFYKSKHLAPEAAVYYLLSAYLHLDREFGLPLKVLNTIYSDSYQKKVGKSRKFWSKNYY
jgi:hypothetical protein